MLRLVQEIEKASRTSCGFQLSFCLPSQETRKSLGFQARRQGETRRDPIMAITRKRKNTSSQEEVMRGGKRVQYTHPEEKENEIPQTPRCVFSVLFSIFSLLSSEVEADGVLDRLQKKRIIIRLITPSAPRKIRLRVPGPKRVAIMPYPSPPLESETGGKTIFGAYVKSSRVIEGEDWGDKRDLNELLELYCLANGFGQGSLKREILEKLESGCWKGELSRESLERCFDELGSGDEVRRWMVMGLVKVLTGGEDLGFGTGDELEDWSWVGEDTREDVLNALRNGEDF
ncbi:hypothetical protein BKA61DRAFT_735670 [Leptodontidium sp. MPI-SDFR-AT-0119]|nr:hypothetical protein BKA61DRAFT_735670 [Leptodontidium sp. MPI-SDFR-AT-0119]